MVALWERFGEIYGNTFDIKKLDGVEFWMTTLNRKGITPKKMARGIDQLLEEGGSFAPSLGEFLKACRTTTPLYHRSFEEQGMIEHTPVQSKEVAQAAMAKMMAGLAAHSSKKPVPTTNPEAQAEEDALIQDLEGRYEQND